MSEVTLLANNQPEKYERSLFILSCLYLMFLRVSELVTTERWTPLMQHFHQDQANNWWFKTIGKGNKLRNIAVSDSMLKALIRWRKHLNLTNVPTVNDTNPLIPKLLNNTPINSTNQIRRIVQNCFDLAVIKLKQQGNNQQADNLQQATVHWLRHTGISEDIKIRPREHVRDDAGHATSATTDRYIDVELHERHASAKNKQLLPED